LGLPRSTIKSQKGKSGCGFGLGKLPNIWVALYYFCNGRVVLLALAELLVEDWYDNSLFPVFQKSAFLLVISGILPSAARQALDTAGWVI